MLEQNNGHEQDEQHTRVFNPNEHIIQIKNRGGAADYLPVQWRLVWFREQCPEGSIETEMVHLDLDRETEEETFAWNSETRRSEKAIKRANGFVIFRAVIKDGKGGMALGTKSEKAASFPDFIEKAETGAIGRALAALGYGTQFAPELDEQHRIVDAPVDRSTLPAESYGNGGTRKPIAAVRPVAASGNGRTNGNGHSTSTPTEEVAADAVASEQQLASIHKLCQHLGKPEPENQDTLSYLGAKELIAQLSLEYRQSRKAS